MIIDCIHCDPNHFIIYGVCHACKRKCEPPLFDQNSSMSILDYQEFRTDWLAETADLIINPIRVIYL